MIDYLFDWCVRASHLFMLSKTFATHKQITVKASSKNIVLIVFIFWDG